MNNAAPRRHPLNVARRNRPAIAQTIPMLDRPRQNISYGLDSAMRMPWKPRQVVLRHVIAKIVEQQKRIEVGSVAKPKRAPQMHSRALKSRLGFNKFLDRSNRHTRSLSQLFLASFAPLRENFLSAFISIHRRLNFFL